MRAWVLVSALVLGALTTGCGPDCEAMCNDAKKCEGAEQSVDCKKSCEDGEKAAESAGCEKQYEDILDCEDDQDDLCKADVCSAEIKALTDCMTK